MSVPDTADGLLERLLAYRHSGRRQEALACCGLALLRNPGDSMVLGVAAGLLREQGNPNAASRLLARALAVDPAGAQLYYECALLLHLAGQPAACVAVLRRALVLTPEAAQTLCDFGAVLHQLGQGALSGLWLSRSLRLDPHQHNALLNLSSVLHWQGRTEAALDCATRLLLETPTAGRALLDRTLLALPVVPASDAAAAAAMRRFDENLRQLRRQAERPALAGELAAAMGESLPFYLAYRQGNQRSRLQSYGTMFAGLMAARHPLAAPSRRTRGRTRLAIVSNHFRRHSIWDVLVHGLLEHLRRDQFEVVLINTMALADEETERARRLADRTHAGLSLEAGLQLLRQEAPDVIYYPEIGMDAVTARLAALRLAPLQLAGWGHPITSGLPTIDRFLSGDLLEADDAQEHYVEALVRLPGTGALTLMPPCPPQPLQGGDWPAETPAGPVRFILCQNPYKFDPADDPLLAAIAAAVPDCQFWVLYEPSRMDLYETLRQRWHAVLRARGINPERTLQWRPWLPRGQFMSLLERVDVYLDCPAFSGYTTAWHAVHCGLPIVTQEGPFLRQRLAAGLLRQIGQADGIAGSPQDYVATAVRLAGECRAGEPWIRRRQGLRAAAMAADNRLEVVRAFERELGSA